jgi:hypothetical protein
MHMQDFGWRIGNDETSNPGFGKRPVDRYRADSAVKGRTINSWRPRPHIRICLWWSDVAETGAVQKPTDLAERPENAHAETRQQTICRICRRLCGSKRRIVGYFEFPARPFRNTHTPTNTTPAAMSPPNNEDSFKP